MNSVKHDRHNHDAVKTDEGGIEFERANLAGEISTPSVPDESFRRAGAFVRRDRGRPAICGGNSRPRGGQLDQLAAQLASAAEKVSLANLTTS
jgi:hypothetical protein